ncbi:transcription elongation factor GreAB [Amphritea balenae]|uniref:Transcription elongation factor GreAB n=1 Tax=Amphritea balenae TaxID=452629 RepID=A0A3P1SRX8_9GAMM|nr:transcription elongation factor GreAB [Amphritea balenae]RRC99931.1 transcription elongation factor GreAB [Amphritea balenae]GGK75187.1 hypothetical protein GCM10007941_26590 [Amphritea balenae]
MNKKQLTDQIVSQLQADLEVNIEAANEAREAAVHDESVPETQYDTLGLEASYLAQGQSKRVEELEMNLADYRNMIMREFDQSTALGLSALVTLENEQGEEKHLFIGPAGGGIHIDFESYTVIVITPEAPIGAALIGRHCGDSVALPQGEFEITAVS